MHCKYGHKAMLILEITLQGDRQTERDGEAETEREREKKRVRKRGG